MDLLTIDEVATELKISKASVRNWEKQGYITPLHNKKYSPIDVTKLKDEIDRGDINRLNKRANKSNSKTRFIPTEYITNNNSISELEIIINFILINNIRPEQALFLLSVNTLVKLGEIELSGLYQALTFEDKSLFKREFVFYELKDWFFSISSRVIKEDNKYCKFLLEVNIPEDRDVLGVVYQSIIREGQKSSLGSYYTPKPLVDSMIEDNMVEEGKVLDPCCGTGQFLLKMAESINDPERIWGADIDGIAIRITRINLFLFYKDLDFKPNIFHVNTLLDWEEKDFSLVATNPPWGAKIDKKDLKELKKTYPEVESKESFSYFIAFILRVLKADGLYSIVLPESILYVKNHRDIRSRILNKSQLSYIYSGGRMFKKVFSSVVRLDGKNTIPLLDSSTDIEHSSGKFSVTQDRFRINQNYIIDIGCSNKDQEIIDYIYSLPYLTLKDRATWALGVVTGNNSLHIKKEREEFMEPIFKGRDIEPLRLTNPENYIYFRPEVYQQCAQESIYRSNEKLIYKFISRDLVFAYDDKKLLTLNSANILIPQIDNYPVKAVGALLNSSIFQFIFKKKFNALKVLRGDIETLPFPNLETNQLDELIILIDDYLANKIDFTSVDNYIFTIFNFSNEYKNHIEEFLTNKT